MKKSLVAIILAGVMLSAVLCGCNGGGKEPENTPGGTVVKTPVPMGTVLPTENTEEG